MNKKCVEFVVEYCKPSCPNWSSCIAEASGFDTDDDRKELLACLIMQEHINNGEEVAGREEEFDPEIEEKWEILTRGD